MIFMADNPEYKTVLFPVNLMKKDIPDIINKTAQVNGLVTIAQGNSVMSAKSLLGLLNVDYDKPMNMLIQAYITDEQLNELKKYEVTELTLEF